MVFSAFYLIMIRYRIGLQYLPDCPVLRIDWILCGILQYLRIILLDCYIMNKDSSLSVPAISLSVH